VRLPTFRNSGVTEASVIAPATKLGEETLKDWSMTKLNAVTDWIRNPSTVPENALFLMFPRTIVNAVDAVTVVTPPVLFRASTLEAALEAPIDTDPSNPELDETEAEDMSMPAGKYTRKRPPTGIRFLLVIAIVTEVTAYTTLDENVTDAAEKELGTIWTGTKAPESMTRVNVLWEVLTDIADVVIDPSGFRIPETLNEMAVPAETCAETHTRISFADVVKAAPVRPDDNVSAGLDKEKSVGRETTMQPVAGIGFTVVSENVGWRSSPVRLLVTERASTDNTSGVKVKVVSEVVRSMATLEESAVLMVKGVITCVPAGLLTTPDTVMLRVAPAGISAALNTARVKTCPMTVGVMTPPDTPDAAETAAIDVPEGKVISTIKLGGRGDEVVNANQYWVERPTLAANGATDATRRSFVVMEGAATEVFLSITEPALVNTDTWSAVNTPDRARLRKPLMVSVTVEPLAMAELAEVLLTTRVLVAFETVTARVLESPVAETTGDTKVTPAGNTIMYAPVWGTSFDNARVSDTTVVA
jgi:hypothetical protein